MSLKLIPDSFEIQIIHSICLEKAIQDNVPKIYSGEKQSHKFYFDFFLLPSPPPASLKQKQKFKSSWKTHQIIFSFGELQCNFSKIKSYKASQWISLFNQLFKIHFRNPFDCKIYICKYTHRHIFSILEHCLENKRNINLPWVSSLLPIK